MPPINGYVSNPGAPDSYVCAYLIGPSKQWALGPFQVSRKCLDDSTDLKVLAKPYDGIGLEGFLDFQVLPRIVIAPLNEGILELGNKEPHFTLELSPTAIEYLDKIAGLRASLANIERQAAEVYIPGLINGKAAILNTLVKSADKQPSTSHNPIGVLSGD